MSKIFSRVLVPAKHRRDMRYGEDFATNVILAVSLRLALLLLIPSLIAIGLIYRESRERAALVEENRAALTYLCQTTGALAAVVSELERVDRTFLGDPGLADTVKVTIRRRIKAYNKAQMKFARREACATVNDVPDK